MTRSIKIKSDLNWRELKALNDLFTLGKTDAKVQGSHYFKYLIEDVKILEPKIGNSTVLQATDEFKEFYETRLLEIYNYYKNFIEQHLLETDARRNYTEEDIKTLILIEKNKTEISLNLSTLRNFSTEFFKDKGSKYLENKASLLKAVFKILNIGAFPEQELKEHQWRLVVDVPSPIAIILCENLNTLKMPWIAEKLNIKLWYVGGNNIKILEQIDQAEFKYPIFYSGDWDLAGLQIYSRIKRKLSEQNKEIKLLYPNNIAVAISVNVINHKSKWDFNKDLSGLDKNDFTSMELNLIEHLIKSNTWIEEESNNLEEMLAMT